jgi:2-polyprenyl-3-methyl-5-hydroxy-6-metoxy-1,4-benzoquinol methylase
VTDVHAERQAALYQGIWATDPSYGTKMEDVKDTVRHRIVPHMQRVYGGHNFTIIDFGAGDGRLLAELGGMIGPWTLMAALDVYKPDVRPRGVKWFQQPMWETLHQTFDYAISTDALEHLPTEMIPATLRNIYLSAPHGFLRISTKQDIYGTERGLHLHETVQPPEWWLDQLRQAGIEPSSWRIYPGHAVEIWF